MRKNVGGLDAVIRVMIGLALLVAAGWAIELMALSVALVVISIPLFWTALTASCPLYSLLGIDSTSADERAPTGSVQHPKA